MRILIDNGNTPAAPRPYIGHYGRLRKAYLEQYRPDLYTALVANEKLHEHCAEIDEAARSRIDLIMPQLARSAGATEALKATDPMKWAQSFLMTKSSSSISKPLFQALRASPLSAA